LAKTDGQQPGLQACQIGGTQRGRLQHLRPVDGRVENVGEALHRPVGGRHAAVDAQDRFALPPQSFCIASSRSRVW
jgi:hypothetical protein